MIYAGLCLASGYLNQDGVQSGQWSTTTAGIMLQRGSERVVTVANHGFQSSDEVRTL